MRYMTVKRTELAPPQLPPDVEVVQRPDLAPGVQVDDVGVFRWSGGTGDGWCLSNPTLAQSITPFSPSYLHTHGSGADCASPSDAGLLTAAAASPPTDCVRVIVCVCGRGMYGWVGGWVRGWMVRRRRGLARTYLDGAAGPGLARGHVLCLVCGDYQNRGRRACQPHFPKHT